MVYHRFLPSLSVCGASIIQKNGAFVQPRGKIAYFVNNRCMKCKH
ncbi:hypothetical protein SUBVAR_07306 [Subdoligranulum variabile DSM 15176]|uniref:Uncharacterized protein n=1 Tax=Subdoligranulum variabile DSM 15176 TaxID=411471 RepID=D1PSC4_9FIRM|nr:hypothetical protein SUBVAR_07306 [Subdoligranulum variabile DSM 15176]